MNQDSAIYCEGLRFSYEDDPRNVLQDVNLEIRKGEFAVIAGPSGEGKSTLCRTFNNIIPLFYRGTLSGKRRVAGEWLERQKISSLARKIGMVFQDFEQQLFSTNTLLELSFGMENFGIPRKEMEERISDLLQRFQMDHLISREPFSLSGGEKQKLAIASVMIYRPEILILDEPTTDLDPESKEFVMESLPRLKNWVETVVIIDHETDKFQAADRVFLLREGVIQASGKPEELLIRPGLLTENSLAGLDLVALQAGLGLAPALLTAPALATSLDQYRLEKMKIPIRAQSPPVIEVNDLSYRYPDQSEPALRQVSFEIRQGEFVGIIGRNGSGKSTLLRHLNGLQMPQDGSVRVLGKEIREWNRLQLAKTAGLVFQNPDHQIFNSSVRTEIEFGPRRFHLSENEIKWNADRAMETMDLTAQAERDPFQLSKGERQRVAVASVLSATPEILILDEPTTGLDHRQQTHLMDLLRELNRNGKTVIIVTHAIKLVGDYCNYAISMQNGMKIAEGNPRELFFQDSLSMKLPPLWELAGLMNGNALTLEEFTSHLRKIQ